MVHSVFAGATFSPPAVAGATACMVDIPGLPIGAGWQQLAPPAQPVAPVQYFNLAPYQPTDADVERIAAAVAKKLLEGKLP